MDQIQVDSLLVVEDQIRTPNVSGGDSDLSDAAVILRVPVQVHIFPLLKIQTRTMESTSIITTSINDSLHISSSI